MTRIALAETLARVRHSPCIRYKEPAVDLLLDIDREYQRYPHDRSVAPLRTLEGDCDQLGGRGHTRHPVPRQPAIVGQRWKR